MTMSDGRTVAMADAYFETDGAEAPASRAASHQTVAPQTASLRMPHSASITVQSMLRTPTQRAVPAMTTAPAPRAASATRIAPAPTVGATGRATVPPSAHNERAAIDSTSTNATREPDFNSEPPTIDWKTRPVEPDRPHAQ